MKNLALPLIVAVLFNVASGRAQPPFDVYECVGMIEYREAHAMVALEPVNDFDAGWVLAMGGSDGDQTLASAELGIILPDGFGPDMWEPVAPMAQARQDFAAVSWGGTLAMACGGYDGSQTLSSTEIFNSESSEWTSGPEMVMPRTNHRVVWMDADRVLITGGFNGVSETASCEILNVATGASAEVAPMLTARASHTLTPLGNGRFLVAGGFNAADGFQLAECEIYNAADDVWTSAAALPVARDNHAATALPGGGEENGVVLTGGRVYNADANLFEGLSEGAVFDPASGTWTAFDLSSPHSYHGMARIVNDPQWFAVGGADETGAGVDMTYGAAEWGNDGVAYAWDNGPLGSGQNPGLISDRFKSAMAPSWAGWVVTGGDAGGIGTCAVVVGPTSVVAEAPADGGFDIVPNPAVGRALIRLSGEAVPVWSILDGSGREVLAGHGAAFDVTDLSAGAYTLRVAGRGSQKLLVAPGHSPR